MKKIMVAVGLSTLAFNVAHSDYNQFINAQMPNDKVAPTFNFLSSTIDDDSRDEFKDLVLEDKQPKGLIIMQIAGVITEEMGGDIQVVVKKQKSTKKASKETATSS